MFDLRITNGHIVNTDNNFRGNIYISDGRIAALTESGLVYQAHEEYDAGGKLVFPGFIDPHSHLNDPGMTESEDFYTGTCSAAAGGITTVLEHPLTMPLPSNLGAIEHKRDVVQPKAVVDFCLFGACTPDNLEEVEKMIRMGAVAFKAFIPYSPEIPQLDDGDMVKHMQNLAGRGVLMAVHCENDRLLNAFTERLINEGKTRPEHYNQARPVLVEVEAVNRIALFTAYSGAKVHVVHCSSGEAVDLVNYYRNSGANISVETCPHFLTLTEEDVLQLGVFGICNPPIRSSEVVKELWKRVLAGEVDFIGSDHATYTFEEKEEGSKNVFNTPAGLSGIQTCFPLFFDEAVGKRGMSLGQFVSMSSTAAARRYNLYPRKGLVAVGADADIVVFDPEKSWEVREDLLFYKQKWTPYMGRKITGKVQSTLVRGMQVFTEDKITAQPGIGKFISPVNN